MEDAMARIRAVLADPLSDDPLPPQSDEVLRDEAIVRAWDEARGYQRPDPEEAMARVWQKIEKLGRTMEESMAFEAAEDTSRRPSRGRVPSRQQKASLQNARREVCSLQRGALHTVA